MEWATDTGSSFGQYAPPASMRQLLHFARSCPANWAGKRAAFALRAIGLRALRGRPLDVESLGARMRLYPAHNVAEKNLLFTPNYFDPEEREYLARALPADFVFLDIGANVGGYALWAAARAGPHARILAVEPQPDIFERLTFNIRQNAFACVKALDCAIADKNGEITLFIDLANKGETSMRLANPDTRAHQVRVRARTLSSVVFEEGFARVDALKLDIEGAEDLALEPFFKEADQALWPRIMIIENEPSRWAIDLCGLIQQLGYGVALRTRTNIIYERR